MANTLQNNVTVTSPFPITAVTSLWEWMNCPRESIMDDFAPSDVGTFALEVARRIENEITAGIYVGSDLVGFVGAIKLSAVAYQLRGLVIDPSYRGALIGTSALILFRTQLKGMGAEKIIGSCFGNNHAIKRLFYRIGGNEEGYIRRVTKVAGQWTDVRMFDL